MSCESLACKTNLTYDSTLPLTKSWSTYIYSLAPKKGNYPPNLEQEETAQWVPNSGNSMLAFQDKTCTYQSRSVPSSSQHFCRWAIFRITSVVWRHHTLFLFRRPAPCGCYLIERPAWGTRLGGSRLAQTLGWFPRPVYMDSADGMAVKNLRYSREFQMIKQSSSELAEDEGTRRANWKILWSCNLHLQRFFLCMVKTGIVFHVAIWH